MRLLPIAFAVAVALLLVACKSSSESDQTSTPSPEPSLSSRATASPVQSATPDTEQPFPELTPFSAELEAELHEIRDRVSGIRGLPIHSAVEEGTLTTEALEAYGRGQFDLLTEQEASNVAVFEAILPLLGLAPPGFSFEDYVGEESNLIDGLFYPAEDRLVLVGEPPVRLSISEELTIAHEYTHSLQDAAYDLETFFDQWVESDDEEDGYTTYRETLECLIEGDAELVRKLYAQSVYGPDWEDQLAAESANGAPADFDIPEFLLNALYFNYSDCAVFVEDLYNDGGWEAVNAAYENPPATTEQVILIDKYYEREPAGEPRPENIDAMVVGWHEDEELAGQWGMFDIYNYIVSRSANYFGAISAADGWNHGWGRVFLRDSREPGVVFEMTLGWDTASDRDEFTEAFDGVLDSHGVDPGDAYEDPRHGLWQTQDEFAQHGAITLDDDGLRVRIIFAQDQATLDLFAQARLSQ